MLWLEVSKGIPTEITRREVSSSMVLTEAFNSDGDRVARMQFNNFVSKNGESITFEFRKGDTLKIFDIFDVFVRDIRLHPERMIIGIRAKKDISIVRGDAINKKEVDSCIY